MFPFLCGLPFIINTFIFLSVVLAQAVSISGDTAIAVAASAVLFMNSLLVDISERGLIYVDQIVFGDSEAEALGVFQDVKAVLTVDALLQRLGVVSG